ncbi:TonB-dependent receptor [Sphingosinicella sp. BN140058]|uniref:TonB-dependent receptor n=1 Tax=Sphingosinicella sp. BN140058 TaxID=1892855 RepID=UPI0013EC0D24|nr:TonB-dependent receptor [Sphingosinicella sp. BN140058]
MNGSLPRSARSRTTTSCIALAVAALPSIAQAQTAPAEQSPAGTDAAATASPAGVAQAAPEEAIVVTGLRGALQSALTTKRNSNDIVDVINAQDIADFPDANVAESLQRVPGIAIERDAGEGRNITVRGLGGDFSRVRLNGLEAISATTGSTLGSTINRGRGFDFSLFASELFNSIVVRKSQSAETDEGSLGATVDLQTARPFDKKGFRAAASLQGAYYEMGKHVQPRVAALISDTFADDTIGVLLSGAYSERTVEEEAYSNTSLADFWESQQGFCPVVPGTAVTPINTLVTTAPFTPNCTPAPGAVHGSTPEAYAKVARAGVFVPRLPGYGRFVNRQKRLGLTGSVQWQPAPATLLTIDGAYSRYDQRKNDYATNPISFNRGNGAAAGSLTAAQATGRPNMKIRDAEVDETGLLRYGVFDDTDFRMTNGYERSETHFYQVSAHLKQDIGERGQVNVLLGQSRSLFKVPEFTLISLDRLDSDGFVFDPRDDKRNPILDFGFDASDPSNWGFINGYSDIRVQRQRVDNKFRNGKIDFQWEFNERLTGKIGYAYKRFTFRTESESRLTSTIINAPLPAGVTIADLSNPIDDFGRGLDLPAGSTTSFIVADIDAFEQVYDFNCNCVNALGDFRIGTAAALGNNRFVRETDQSPYAQIDFNFPLGGEWVLRGNVGARYAHTKQFSTGFISATLPIVEARRTYDDFLPAANLALEIGPDLIVRLAAAKALSRPALGNLTPGGAVSTTGNLFTSTVGNPNLTPFRSTNLDAGIEWYFQKGAVLSAAVFQKKLKSFAQQLLTQTTVGESGIPASAFPTGTDPNTPINITNFQSTEGGTIRGLEINYQQPFTFLPGFLKNFGALINYTHIDSRISYFLTANRAGPVLRDELINVSPNSLNATLYYEAGGFSARVSGAYRSQYLRQVPLRAGLADATGSYSTFNVDASISYDITPNVGLNIDMLNLTDQPTDFWNGQTIRDQQVYSKTGRQFFVGLRVRY